MEVYVCQAVRDVEALHGGLADPAFRDLPISEQLERQARRLQDAHGQGDARVVVQVTNWLPGAAGRSAEQILAAAFSLEEARLTIAREHGFAGWDEVRALGAARLDGSFEAALDALLAGDLETLRGMIEAEPDLVRRRSRFGHRATLLHYIGANGVETQRQKTPLNAVALARLLIERGAEVGAEAGMYGGGQTTLGLVKTSAHPAAAGVTPELCALLEAASA